MGKVSGNWITGTHSGRACRHDDIYTRVNKKTGACYSVKLCNPNTDWSDKVLKNRSAFGTVNKAISAWINTNKENSGEAHADYLKVKKQYDRQTKYATLRGMMMAKGMYSVDADGKVTIDVDRDNSADTTPSDGGSTPSGGGSQSGGETPTPNPGGGEDDNMI